MNSTTDMVGKTEVSNIASSGNLSEAPYGVVESLSFMHVLPGMYGILCFTGVISNGLVLYAVATCKKKMVSDIYVLNLAIADMLFLLVMPFTIHQLVWDQQWVFGNFMCKAVTVIDVSNQFTTVGIVTVLCIDRYVAIVHPTSEKRTIRCTTVINIMVWVTSFLLTIPVMLYTHTEQEDLVEMCMMDLPRGPIDMYWYTLHQSMIGFIIPLVIISTFYSLALCHVFRSERTVKRRQSVWAKRATKTVVMVITIFLLCWSPYHVIQIININIHSPTSAFLLAYHISICLSYSHSCINPIVLLIFAQNYRERIWQRKGRHAG